MAETIAADDPALVRQRAAAVLAEGGLVVAPTDTSYALLADAFQMDATQRLFTVRGADRAHPLPVIVRNTRQLGGLVRHTSEQAERLMAAYWPGPLTLVFEANRGLAWDLGDTGGAVAVRMPDEPLLSELIGEVGPLACTAAARVSAPPAPTVGDARASLGDEVDLYVDGGERPATRSTIVDVSRGGAEVLRVGAVSADDVFAAATGALDWGDPREGTDAPADPEPGPADDEAGTASEADAGAPDAPAAGPTATPDDPEPRPGRDDEEPAG